jgi:hypothetical protein
LNVIASIQISFANPAIIQHNLNKSFKRLRSNLTSNKKIEATEEIDFSKQKQVIYELLEDIVTGN